MFSKESSSSGGGEKESRSNSSAPTDTSRKTAAKKLIERYYHQVTKGCENSNCVNTTCAQYSNKPLTGNEGAITALKLFKERAELCVGDLTVKVEPVHYLTEEKITKLVTSCQETNNFSPLIRILGEVFTNSQYLNKSFLGLSNETSKEETVDLESVRRVYKILFDLKNAAVENTLINSLVSLSTSIEFEVNSGKYSKDSNYYRQFLIIFENYYLNQPEYLENAFPCFCKAVSLLPTSIHTTLVRLWSGQSRDLLRRKIESLQHLITFRVIDGPSVKSNTLTVNDDDVIINATKCLKLFYYSSIVAGSFDNLQTTVDKMDASNSNGTDALATGLQLDILDCREPLIPFDEFINEPLNEQIAVDRDFTHYKTKEGFSFMNYNFILTTTVKNKWIFYDNRVNMLQERRLTHFYSILRGQQPVPYLKLRVTRDNLIQDALVNLEMIYQDNPNDLKKQLFVEFAGEQGLDEGGVSKEFFQLIVEHIFNPDYGMFTFDADTRQCWFNQTSFESEAQFTLIGLIFGIAIYNNIILDVHFPMVVYRKLFGRPASMVDLKDSHPVIASSLQSILDYEGEVDDTFLVTFSLSYNDVFGNVFTHELIEGGKDKPVTNKNRQKFVDLYVDYILNKSVEKQFTAFKHGFDMVTEDSPLKQLFRPEEVELLVCGSKDFDFEALQSAAEYDGGYTENSLIIRWFWDTVHQFSLDQKKQLLMFITGSDRVPIGGLAKLKLIIARQGPDSNSLPTAHTCFNVLLIPDYNTKSKLEERLVKAITYSKGFGLI